RDGRRALRHRRQTGVSAAESWGAPLLDNTAGAHAPTRKLSSARALIEIDNWYAHYLSHGYTLVRPQSAEGARCPVADRWRLACRRPHQSKPTCDERRACATARATRRSAPGARRRRHAPNTSGGVSTSPRSPNSRGHRGGVDRPSFRPFDLRPFVPSRRFRCCCVVLVAFCDQRASHTSSTHRNRDLSTDGQYRRSVGKWGSRVGARLAVAVASLPRPDRPARLAVSVRLPEAPSPPFAQTR